MGLILGVCAGGLVVLILLLGAIIIIIKKGRDYYSYSYYPGGGSGVMIFSFSLTNSPNSPHLSLPFSSRSISLPPLLLSSPSSLCLLSRKPVNMNKTPITYRQEKSNMMGSMERSFTDQSTLQEDERMALSFMDTHTCSTRSDPRSSMNESSSLLGGSPRRQCGRKGSPYHTGQLHPAVRVADLLQHINQMKTAEGYGFKQEYESFFDGWDINKKKDKTKGRHDTLMGYDRHRVKLHPLLGDPNSDYINANYIDGYHRSNHFIATQGEYLCLDRACG
ncbi:Receptor-type tyrosine-protein phosphatase U [Labeo rohita]|uniref:protein-tyrosine-phosphatase n=1 Tax=Labeo rohita TaxID=84645 RepID=A0ABQ8LWT2_LABRO|nr:Receptor-type tyrosine-protein phosphatase U [Labeo rohita]